MPKLANPKPKMSDYKTNERSWWCPGCGDFGVLASLQRALVDLGKQPHEVALVAGIGCSGKIGNYVNAYNFHVVHGRALPTAMGIKLANRDLTVIAAGGDGDGYAIGANHFLHALRRNVDVTYIVMDNQIYGLTKGQVSPTSGSGFVTRTSPEGNIERPIRPLQLAIAAGASYVASGFSSDVRQLSRLIADGINHKGFALINAYSPCVTFNKINTYDWFKEVLQNLDEDDDYDPTNRTQALSRLIETDEQVRGLVYKSDQPSYQELFPGYREEPIVHQDWTMPQDDFNKLMDRFR